MATKKTKKKSAGKKKSSKGSPKSTSKKKSSEKSVSKKSPSQKPTPNPSSKQAPENPEKKTKPTFSFDPASLPHNLEVKESKGGFTIKSKSGSKKVFLMRSGRLYLEDYKALYGKDVIAISPEESKKRHLGKTRSVSQLSGKSHLLELLKKYFASN